MSNYGYKKFSDYYDIYTDIIDYESWAEYIISLSDLNLENKKILDLGCGSGNMMIEMSYLLDADYYGVDLSEEMLSFADQNAFLENINIKLFKSDMSEFKINEQFGMIYCAFDSINYLLKDEQMLSTFNNAYDMLEPGGIFTFDVINSENILLEENIDIENVFFKIVRSIEDGFMYTELRIYEDCRFTVKEEHKQRLYTIGDYKKIANKSKFEGFQYYDFLTREDVNEDTDKIQIILKKT